jgi:hypothetical protein
MWTSRVRFRSQDPFAEWNFNSDLPGPFESRQPSFSGVRGKRRRFLIWPESTEQSNERLPIMETRFEGLGNWERNPESNLRNWGPLEVIVRPSIVIDLPSFDIDSPETAPDWLSPDSGHIFRHGYQVC